MLSGKFNVDPAPRPKLLSAHYNIAEFLVNQRKTWTINPKKGKPKKVFLFLHGGAYIHNITGLHWQLIEKLLSKTNVGMVVPDYPLAPSANYQDVYSFIQAVYDRLLLKYQPKEIIFMGDSAGGGLALGFSQYLRDGNQPQPDQLILISPWLDVTMSNPDLPTMDRKDKLLGIRGLQLAGKAYASSEDPKNYKISPIFGDLCNLPKISLFIGTHDLMFCDSKALKEKLQSTNQKLNYFEYPKMIHDWMLITQLKEAKVAIDQIISLINFH